VDDGHALGRLRGLLLEQLVQESRAGVPAPRRVESDDLARALVGREQV
jgi:hypothetical protein